MIEIDIDPKLIWCFQPDVGVSRILLEEISRKGWSEIKRVPIFQIPIDVRKNNFEYILIDGHHRRNVAEHLKQTLPCTLYEIGEKIDLDRDNLAYFRHYNDPKMYDKLLSAFVRKN